MPLVQREQESIIHWILIIFHEYHYCQNPITILPKIAECNIILSLCFDQSCVITDRVSISIQTLPVWAPATGFVHFLAYWPNSVVNYFWETFPLCILKIVVMPLKTCVTA